MDSSALAGAAGGIGQKGMRTTGMHCVPRRLPLVIDYPQFAVHREQDP